METMTFVHVFESATAKDSSSVSAILDEVFIQLKTIMLELQSIYILSYNAGCYHCAQTLIPAPQIAKRVEEGCVKTFIRHSSLVQHLGYGKHKRILEYETLFDRAMIDYATHLDCGASKCSTVLEGSKPSLPTVPTTLPMGWALEWTQYRSTKVTDNQKQYLNSKFQIGERTGKTADPTDEVSKAMRTAKDRNGERLFSYGNFLTNQQFSSYFSRLASK
ncbi:hypothetical protein AWC38_SpisGene23111 [Stylophora pistillata]|uniref:C2H2-type domain-containing protein n=1 Tax=Stylophora pistillata TaxID=50429 RepID=A0A2B4R7R1_STYPI|nr:hypothetical protein AWC38_SpisGene23111 [Stylophora pistillata]